MLRDEGTEPSIQFKERMRARVERTPTSIVVVALPFLITARIALFARHKYVKSRSKAMARRINVTCDLRTEFGRVVDTEPSHVDRAA